MSNITLAVSDHPFKFGINKLFEGVCPMRSSQSTYPDDFTNQFEYVNKSTDYHQKRVGRIKFNIYFCITITGSIPLLVDH